MMYRVSALVMLCLLLFGCGSATTTAEAPLVKNASIVGTWECMITDPFRLGIYEDTTLGYFDTSGSVMGWWSMQNGNEFWMVWPNGTIEYLIVDYVTENALRMSGPEDAFFECSR